MKLVPVRSSPLYSPPRSSTSRVWLPIRRPYRYFLNSATDLLKYVYYFSAAMALLTMRDNPEFPPSELNYAIVTRKRDFSILRMYPDVLDMEGAKFYVYRSEKDPGAD